MATVMSFFLYSCGKEQQAKKDLFSSADTIPDLITTNVNTLISDSGVLRYKMLSPEWIVFMRGENPRWVFEKGIYMEKFDSLFRVDASIKADTAYYYQLKKLWELKGNVHIKNLEGVRFDTQQLFWDQAQEKFYSYKRVNIAKKDTVISGDRFESNQQMTDYILYNSQGNMLIKDKPAKDTIPTKQ